MKKLITICLILCVCVLSANAVPVVVTYYDSPEQDPLMVPNMVDELGNGFPPDELIISDDMLIDLTACIGIPYDDPLIPNVIVDITNLTGRVWTDLWYVADPETSLTNYDGLINGELAFKIDYLGMNVPLVFESMTPNAIFEIGEMWAFIIQDYINGFGLAPSLFGSVGLVGALSGGDPFSSGSIIAIPEPATMILLAAGLFGIRKLKR